MTENALPTIDLAALEREVVKAIFDPGAYAGAKGDRPLYVWQSHAVMFVFRSFSQRPAVDSGESGGS